MLRALALTVSFVACSVQPEKPASPESAPVATLALDEVEARLRAPGVYVFDANPREMFERGHLPGAKWVAWDELAAEDLPADRQAMLIFYCANEWCTASHESARLASRLGYANVFVMPRGILGWKKSGKPVETGP